MAKFSPTPQLARPRRRGVTFTSVRGAECVADITVLTCDDDAAIMNAAHKATNATRGDDYDLRAALESALRFVVDPESPDDAPEPYFGSIEEINRHFTRDTLVYLTGLQATLQSEGSVLARELTADEYAEAIIRYATMKPGDAEPYPKWAPSMRLSFERMVARQLFAADIVASTPPQEH